MNIFVLDQDPWVAAQHHCDKHVVKMILETAQMLSTALTPYGVQGLYKPSYQHHPCTRWAASNRQHFAWLADLGHALCDEYTYRYDKRHKSEAVIDVASFYADRLPFHRWEDWPLAMPDKYKCEDPVESYRAYYIGEKAHFAVYTGRPVPEWLVSAFS